MAKERVINTRFWSDNYISELDPVEKLMFLYFITNPYTEICGIYEISMKQIALDTGIDRQEMIPKILARFSRDGKIYYIDGWIYIKNFAKWQKKNPSVEIGIQRGLELVPAEITAQIKQLEQTGTDCDSVEQIGLPILRPKPILKPKPRLITADADFQKNEINKIMDLFYVINPSLSFGKKPERDSAAALIKKFTFPVAMEMVKTVLSVQGEPYAPVVTTPNEMWTKLPKLAIFLKNRKNNNSVRQA